MMIDQNYLKQVFEYKDGDLVWRSNRGKKVKAGTIAGYDSGHGYRKVNLNNKQLYVHRLVFMYHYGVMPKYIDHIDGNRSNNTIENLRECTSSENNKNRKMDRRNKTGIKGVFYDKARSKYVGCVASEGKVERKRFNTKFEAACFANSKRESMHKQFANDGAYK